MRKLTLCKGCVALLAELLTAWLLRRILVRMLLLLLMLLLRWRLLLLLMRLMRLLTMFLPSLPPPLLFFLSPPNFLLSLPLGVSGPSALLLPALPLSLLRSFPPTIGAVTATWVTRKAGAVGEATSTREATWGGATWGGATRIALATGEAPAKNHLGCAGWCAMGISNGDGDRNGDGVGWASGGE